ncbi:MAG: hypothetical protein EB084_22425 [Proteobacteria bacterium]|nr:hypothetical protein [Pseudomonadota bacterium]
MSVAAAWRTDLAGDWRSLWRRRGRALLTSTGMACGVFALVLMGALSEHFRLLTAHFADPFDGRLYVCEKLSFWAGGGLIDEDRAAEAARVDGVSAVVPVVMGVHPRGRAATGSLPALARRHAVRRSLAQ